MVIDPNKTTDQIVCIFKLHDFKHGTRHKKDSELSSVEYFRIYTGLNVLVNAILIYYLCSQKFELRHILERFIRHNYIIILSEQQLSIFVRNCQSCARELTNTHTHTRGTEFFS